MKYNKATVKKLFAQEAILLILAIIAIMILSLALEINSISWWIGFLIVLILSLLIGLIYIPLLWHNTGWKIDDDKLYIKGGVIFIKYSYIPINQIVNVFVIKNPLTPILNIATVVVKATAANGKLKWIDLNVTQYLTSRLSSYKDH